MADTVCRFTSIDHSLQWLSEDGQSKDDPELPDDCVGQDIRRAFVPVKELCMYYGLPFRTLPTLTSFLRRHCRDLHG